MKLGASFALVSATLMATANGRALRNQEVPGSAPLQKAKVQHGAQRTRVHTERSEGKTTSDRATPGWIPTTKTLLAREMAVQATNQMQEKLLKEMTCLCLPLLQRFKAFLKWFEWLQACECVQQACRLQRCQRCVRLRPGCFSVTPLCCRHSPAVCASCWQGVGVASVAPCLLRS